MQDNNLFEYAVIRIVPKVEREEFVNVGVVLFCAKQKFLKCLYRLDYERLRAFSKSLDFEIVEANLESFEKICLGGKDAGPLGELDPASRFRWLTAMRSTVIQTSRVHPGFCSDPEISLKKLFEGMVLED